jgi:hypothetical protein
MQPGLRVALESYGGTYDTSTGRWLFPEATDFEILLPQLLHCAGGDVINIDSINALFAHAVAKYAAPCTCLRAVTDKAKGRARPCVTCAFKTSVEVQRGGTTCSLVEARLSSTDNACMDLIRALLYNSPAWPYYFAAGRGDPEAPLPANANRNVLFKTAPTDGLQRGAHFSVGMLCEAPGCNACVFVCANKDEPQLLSVRFAGAHSHPALPCAAHRAAGCTQCPAYGFLPLAEPFSRLGAVYGAMALSTASESGLQGRDGGAAGSASALFRACAARQPVEELLSGNRARSGADVTNISTLLNTEHDRIADRAGATLPLSGDLDGPQDSVSAVYAQLVRAAALLRRAAARGARADKRRRSRCRVPRRSRAQSAWAASWRSSRAAAAWRCTCPRLCVPQRARRCWQREKWATRTPPAASPPNATARHVVWGCLAQHAAVADARGRQYLEFTLTVREPGGQGALDIAVMISQDKSELGMTIFLQTVQACMLQYVGAC